jgi:hypothetical protein
MGPGKMSVSAARMQLHQCAYLDLVPVLAGERIEGLLLDALLTL